MFIRLKGIEYRADQIKSFQNLWRKNDKKEYEKNGCIVELLDGERFQLDHHLSESEFISHTIIPATDGWHLILYCDDYSDEFPAPLTADAIDFSFEPVIGWYVTDCGATPFTPQTGYSEIVKWAATDMKTVITSFATYKSVEEYKAELFKQIIKK